MKGWFRRARPPAPSDVLGTIGHLDMLDAGLLTGWAYRPTAPERRVRIRVIVDGRAVAEDLADVHRADLESAGRGDGRHGFAITLPSTLLDGREHAIDLVDVDTGAPLCALARRHRLDRRRDPVQACVYRLCDPAFYRAQAGPVPFPLDHYRERGWLQGLDPHPLFSTSHYLARYGPLAGDPLTHFATTGQWANAWVHPILDERMEAPAERPQDRRVGEDDAGAEAPKLHPLLAYLGGPSAPERSLSRYFSDADYVARYPAAGHSGAPPLAHYLDVGWRDGLRPHPDFDPRLFARLAALDGARDPYTHLLAWLNDRRRRQGLAAAIAPEVSVIMLNHNKSLLTFQCLYFLDAFTEPGFIEVVVVDNGSCPAEFERLARHSHGVTLVRLASNRGFGEANNIGVEHARGRLLMFINNDAFVRPGWLGPLQEAIESDPGVGAAGTKLLYPDGRLQEAGATISACGTVVQRGKHLDPQQPAYNRQEAVDYCSAAAMMVRAEAFRAVLGFDLAWDPAYYEDVDLCLKLRTLGLATLYVPRSEIVHIEHATSTDTVLELQLHDIVAVNRLTFVGRWGDWLAALPGARPPSLAAAPADGPARASTVSHHSANARPLLALYSPLPLVPGGGERYLLGIAASLRTRHRCVLLTPDRYSRLRLLTMGRELGLDLDHVEVRLASQAAEVGPIALFVCMSNELLPPLRGLGRQNLYHCQFPFPMQPAHHSGGWCNLDSYQGVVVNAGFTARHYAAAAEALGIDPPPLHVLPPPVPQAAASDLRGRDKVRRILSVGRFAPDGHSKRQDLMIDAFARLREQVDEPLELHLAGSVGVDGTARAYLQELVAAARDLPVRFHPNASAERLAALHGQADLYWHLTGTGEDVMRNPERFEHFGIALVEAMSAGVVPVALGMGGPAEILTDGENGVLIAGVPDLSRASARLLADAPRWARLSAAARLRAASFTPDVFARNLRTIVEGLPAAAPCATPLSDV